MQMLSPITGKKETYGRSKHILEGNIDCEIWIEVLECRLNPCQTFICYCIQLFQDRVQLRTVVNVVLKLLYSQKVENLVTS
jgi:hypothetical protein